MVAPSDYRPLDLDAWRNAGADALGGSPATPFGERTLRGIPFSLGADAARNLVAFGEGHRLEPLVVPVEVPVRTVVFAHRLLESHLAEGAPIGAIAATYVFGFASGASLHQPVRERFEISRPGGAMEPAALALEDAAPRVHADRYVGPYGQASRRLTDLETSLGTLLLWTWHNPRPDDPLCEIAIEPGVLQMAIGGITLGFLDEDPLVPAAARPMIVELLDGTAAAKSFDLDVAIDRGYASYAYPLPRARGEAFLGSPLPGFGMPGPYGTPQLGTRLQQHPTSPAYARVAAVPSATLTITSDRATAGEVAWRDVEGGEPVERAGVRVRLVDSGRNWVRTTIVDDATGEPIPCRIHFRSPDGIPYQPHGHQAEVNAGLSTHWQLNVGGDLVLGDVPYAYVDGSCEGWLPRGEVAVDVARGFEYEPLRTKLEIAPGQRELTLRLRRWSDLTRRGWYSGDTHVHFLSPQGAELEARGEGVNVVNLLATQWGELFTNGEDFVGRPVRSRDAQTIVYTSQENRQHFLGHLSLLGLKRPVMPWASDGPPEDGLGGSLEATLSHWADEARAQGATVVMPHAPLPNGEPATLVATGRADAFEHLGGRDGIPGVGWRHHREYYRFLNCGYRLPLVGGTDKMGANVAVGLMRTYVRIPDEEFSYESWCRNLRAGRTFISSGPLITLEVEGSEVGDTVRLPKGGGMVEVVATVESVLPVESLQIVMGGAVVAATNEVKADRVRRLELRTRIRVDEHTWIAARAGAQDYFQPMLHDDAMHTGIKAHTSPVYVACGGKWEMFDADVAREMLSHVGLALGHVRAMRLRERPDSMLHRHGEADHQAFLERPFHEAQAVLEERLRRHRAIRNPT